VKIKLGNEQDKGGMELINVPYLLRNIVGFSVRSNNKVFIINFSIVYGPSIIKISKEDSYYEFIKE
jgi:hypothetical protein